MLIGDVIFVGFAVSVLIFIIGCFVGGSSNRKSAIELSEAWADFNHARGFYGEMDEVTVHYKNGTVEIVEDVRYVNTFDGYIVLENKYFDKVLTLNKDEIISVESPRNTVKGDD